MYKIYLNDNSNKNIKEVIDKLEDRLIDKYKIYRNMYKMTEEEIIEDSNNEKVNIHISIKISINKENNVYYNANNSYSAMLYNLIKKECENSDVILINKTDKKKEIVDIIVPCLYIEFNKDNLREEIIISILEKVINNYFEQEVI